MSNPIAAKAGAPAVTRDTTPSDARLIPMPLIHLGHGTFQFRCAYEDRHTPRSAGFVFDRTRRAWLSRDMTVVGRVLEHASPEAIDAVNGERASRETRRLASYATESTFRPVGPSDLTYRPYQNAGIERILQQYRLSRSAVGVGGLLLADDMGVGKTVQAAGLISNLPSLRRILIVVPASLRLNWRDELHEKCALAGRTVAVQGTYKKKRLYRRKKETAEEYAARQAQVDARAAAPRLPDANIVIISYDMAATVFNDAIHAETWDLVICDEAHYLKNSSARRTSRLLGIDKQGERDSLPPVPAEFVLFLTGTPILKAPQDLWPLLRRIDPYGLGANFYRYATRYCGYHETPFGHDFRTPGEVEQKELNVALRGTVMLRRLRSDVLKDLPGKSRTILRLEATPFLQKMIDRHDAEISELREALDEAETAFREVSDEKARAIAEGMPVPPAVEKRFFAAEQTHKRAANQMRGALARALHEVALAKLPDVKEQIQGVLDCGEKVIVFATHKDVVNTLAEHFPCGSVVVTGDTDNRKAHELVRRFQTDPDCRILFGNIIKAGVGHTMTAASHVIFAEMDSRDAIMRQAEDRADRYGQTTIVQSKWLLLEGSVEEMILRAIQRKERVSNTVLNSVERSDSEKVPTTTKRIAAVPREPVPGSAKRTAPPPPPSRRSAPPANGQWLLQQCLRGEKRAPPPPRSRMASFTSSTSAPPPPPRRQQPLCGS